MNYTEATNDKEAPIFIVGAGPSGLAAGWRLSKMGRPVILLESRDRVGGQLWTIKENGLFYTSIQRITLKVAHWKLSVLPKI